MDKVDVIVIGAGVVGLAIAAEVTEKYPQACIALFDKEQQFGWHTSSRSSSSSIAASPATWPQPARTSTGSPGATSPPSSCRIRC